MLEFKWKYYVSPAERVTALECRDLTSETAIKIALSMAETGRPESMQCIGILATRRPGGEWVPVPH